MGRPYHPQTQGSIEVANRTFKRRLAALQTAKGCPNWVELLPELALTINTTCSSALPRRKTPFEVWFSRKPHWLSPQPKDLNDEDQDNETDDCDNEDDDSNDDNSPDLVLSEIETWVTANNTCLHAQMIKANSSRSAIFAEGSIATLQIPPKLRLGTEPTRLPVRVIKYQNGQYLLQCQHGRLSGRYQGGQLNSIDRSTADIIGGSIRTTPERKGGKDVTISFATAVAKENHRGSITAAQKAGRKAPGKKAAKASVTKVYTGHEQGDKRTQAEVIGFSYEGLHGTRTRGQTYTG